MKLIPSLLCSALALTGCTNDGTTGSPSAPAETDDTELARGNPIQARIEQLASSDGVYGVLAQITRGTDVRRARAGIADVEQRGPVAWDSRFRIASATKPFVATVVLQLVGEGKLSLDDTVEHWLPGVVHGNGGDGNQILVRQLLQHTSGVPDYSLDILAAAGAATTIDELHTGLFQRWTIPQLLALALAHPATNGPGAAFAYSNTNYVLLGMVIHAVTGSTWQDEVTTRIIEPLGLTQTTTLTTNPFIAGTHPHAYEVLGGGLDVTEVSPTSLDAAAAMISTPHDLDVFLRALIQGKLLHASELAQMQQTIPADELFPGARYGLGLEWRPLTCGGGYWSHAGDGLGFHVRNGATVGGNSVALTITSDMSADLDAAADPVVEAALCAH